MKENVQLSRGGDAGLISRMGAYEESRRKLREERNREYNQFLAKVSVSKFGTTVMTKPHALAVYQVRDIHCKQASIDLVNVE